MDLSICIVNYRGWEDLARLLESLEPLVQSESAPRVEIIVTDNASGDGRLERFRERHQGVRFVENSGNLGFAHGCNRAAEQATGDTLLFLNPDALDPGGQIERFWSLKVEHPEIGILTVRQVDEKGRGQKVFDAFPSALSTLGPIRALLRRLAPQRYRDARTCQDALRRVDWVSGSALMIGRKDFNAVGGWSEDYWMYSEDVDLCFRARQQGLHAGFSAEATLEHRHGGTSRRNLEVAAMTRSEVVISKHVYARRNFGALHAFLVHTLILISRFLPTLIAWPLAWMIPHDGIRVRARMVRFLGSYYRAGLLRGHWISPRAAGDCQTSPPAT